MFALSHIVNPPARPLSPSIISKEHTSLPLPRSLYLLIIIIIITHIDRHSHTWNSHGHAFEMCPEPYWIWFLRLPKLAGTIFSYNHIIFYYLCIYLYILRTHTHTLSIYAPPNKTRQFQPHAARTQTGFASIQATPRLWSWSGQFPDRVYGRTSAADSRWWVSFFPSLISL